MRTKDLWIEPIVRLFCIWESLHQIVEFAKQGNYFTCTADNVFAGHSDEVRVLVSEREYFDTPRLLPVSLKDIEDCVNNRRKEVDKEQAQELAELIFTAKAEEEKEESLLLKNVLVIVKPQYIVIDTNSFIDGLDTIIALSEDPALTILVPTPVIWELRGLRYKSAGADQDEKYAKFVCQEAARSLETLEHSKRKNLQLLFCNGVPTAMDPCFEDPQTKTKMNNDRLIIEATRAFSERVCPRSIRIPRGDIWIFRDVLLVTRDRIMMLLANGYRLPSLDVFSFAKWAGFSVAK